MELTGKVHEALQACLAAGGIVFIGPSQNPFRFSQPHLAEIH